MRTATKAKRTKNQGGQILVLMAMLSTTLMVLFGMVVSIGHLVQAKINLQNAVDLASQTGASYQARFLNHISLVNYRMRQNYKFTLYDLYVVQSRFNQGFADQVAPGGSFDLFEQVNSSDFVFGICQQAAGYCGTVEGNKSCTSTDTNMCQNVRSDELRKIPPVKGSSIPISNPILAAANQLVIALGAKVKQYCDAARTQNRDYFDYITKRLDEQQRFQMGIIVDILDKFDKTFSDGTAVNPNGPEADRAIYQTFSDNLIAANRDGSVQLDWLTPPEARAYRDPNVKALETSIFNVGPPGGPFSKYFDRQKVFFRLKVVRFESTNGCTPIIDDEDYKGKNNAGVFLGLSRARTDEDTGPVKIPFNVALRGIVKPNLLFWPRGMTPTLVAVGGSKPFGSRIGPSAIQTITEVGGDVSNRNDPFLANMSFYPGDFGNPGKYTGVGHKRILSYLLSRMKNPDTGENALRPRIRDIGGNCDSGSPAFACLALAPTFYEGFFWNPFAFPIPELNRTFGDIASSMRAIFPNEFVPLLKRVTGPEYDMPDRLDSSVTTDYHRTTYLDAVTQLQMPGKKPAFFATTQSASSSWTPSVDPAGSNIVSELKVRGRQGFQIKLVALSEICEEFDAGGTITSKGALAPYCKGGAAEVFH